MKKNIVFTMWQNDLVALKLWLKYYSQHFDKLFILCFNTKKKYISELNDLKRQYEFDFEIVEEFEGDKIDGDPNVALGLVKYWQRRFVNEYDWVLFANIDEILVPIGDKSLKNLMVISPKDKWIYICEGYEVIQIKGEKPIDYSKPYFKQRKYWIKNPAYNKIILSRISLDWNAGLHQIQGISEDESKAFKKTGLYLIHLKHADLQAKDRDFGPRISPLNPNIEQHWLDRKEKIPEYIKRIL